MSARAPSGELQRARRGIALPYEYSQHRGMIPPCCRPFEAGGGFRGVPADFTCFSAHA